MAILSHRSFPKAILHVDGDSFFASCEVAKNPALRGKPVITGKERGIVSSMSYEAKARGVSRAMRLSDVKKVCPDAVILPSDYETYSLYSKRMYEVVRRYTPDIEEYSIDECFADLTGMRRANKMPYEAMAIKIKHELDTELGMSFSIGLAVNKVTAKVASKWKKPSGLTIIPARDLHRYLATYPVEKIWGIGPQTTAYLRKFNITTSLQFATQKPEWVETYFSKPFQEIHKELNGHFIYPLTLGEKHDYASISKTKTFTPPSTSKEFVFSQLSKNVENAFIKLRRHNLFTKEFSIFLKTQDFRYCGLDFKLNQTVCVPQEILSIIRANFDRIFKSGKLYRATGITLTKITNGDTQTIDLFGKSEFIDRIKEVYKAVDEVSARYGKHTVFLGSSFKAMNNPGHHGDRGEKSERRNHLFKGETARKRLKIPFIGQTT